MFDSMFWLSVLTGIIVATLKLIVDKKPFDFPVIDRTNKYIHFGYAISYIIGGGMFGIFIGFLGATIFQLFSGINPILDIIFNASPAAITGIVIILGIQNQIYKIFTTASEQLKAIEEKENARYIKLQEQHAIILTEKDNLIKNLQDQIDSLHDTVSQMRQQDFIEQKEGIYIAVKTDPTTGELIPETNIEPKTGSNIPAPDDSIMQ